MKFKSIKDAKRKYALLLQEAHQQKTLSELELSLFYILGLSEEDSELDVRIELLESTLQQTAELVKQRTPVIENVIDNTKYIDRTQYIDNTKTIDQTVTIEKKVPAEMTKEKVVDLITKAISSLPKQKNKEENKKLKETLLIIQNELKKVKTEKVKLEQLVTDLQQKIKKALDPRLRTGFGNGVSETDVLKLINENPPQPQLLDATLTYTGSQLTKVTTTEGDTDLAYSGTQLTTVTLPNGIIATLTYSGSQLTAVTYT